MGKLHKWCPSLNPRETMQIPLHPISDPYLFYRSLVNFLKRLSTTDRITSYLETSYPVASNQWGFLSKRSTTYALMSAVHDWLTEMEKGNEVAAVFFDLTKAFDSVPHRHLVNKLETIGLDKHLIKWITNYLTN